MAERLTRQGVRDLGGNGGPGDGRRPRRRDQKCLPGEHEFRATHRTREAWRERSDDDIVFHNVRITERLYECRFCREEDWR